MVTFEVHLSWRDFLAAGSERNRWMSRLTKDTRDQMAAKSSLWSRWELEVEESEELEAGAIGVRSYNCRRIGRGDELGRWEMRERYGCMYWKKGMEGEMEHSLVTACRQNPKLVRTREGYLTKMWPFLGCHLPSRKGEVTRYICSRFFFFFSSTENKDGRTYLPLWNYFLIMWPSAPPALAFLNLIISQLRNQEILPRCWVCFK